MVAHNASKPADAPLPSAHRTALPLGFAAAAALAIVVVALGVRGIGNPQGVGPGANATPTATATATPSPTATQPAPTSTPRPSTTPVSPPAAASDEAARNLLDRYTAYLVAGNYAAAWAMLGPEERQAVGSLASFTAERSAFFASVGGRYSVTPSPKNQGTVASWASSANGAKIDLQRAVLVEVDYPALAGNNAGFNLYIVNPGATGPLIYTVR